MKHVNRLSNLFRNLAVIPLITIVASAAHADLFLDCSSVTPTQLKALKASPITDPCLDSGTSIVVLTHTNLLFECEQGRTVASFDVALGRGGLGKSREQDLKTPVGTYSLSKPRASERFGLFIPVGYPTAEQRAQGFTGGDIGIHGPDRTFACAGALNVSLNWTTGCIALASDTFLVQVSEFVKAHPALQLHIR